MFNFKESWSQNVIIFVRKINKKDKITGIGACITNFRMLLSRLPINANGTLSYVAFYDSYISLRHLSFLVFISLKPLAACLIRT